MNYSQVWTRNAHGGLAAVVCAVLEDEALQEVCSSAVNTDRSPDHVHDPIVLRRLFRVSILKLAHCVSNEWNVFHAREFSTPLDAMHRTFLHAVRTTLTGMHDERIIECSCEFAGA